MEYRYNTIAIDVTNISDSVYHLRVKNPQRFGDGSVSVFTYEGARRNLLWSVLSKQTSVLWNVLWIQKQLSNIQSGPVLIQILYCELQLTRPVVTLTYWIILRPSSTTQYFCYSAFNTTCFGLHDHRQVHNYEILLRKMERNITAVILLSTAYSQEHWRPYYNTILDTL